MFPETEVFDIKSSDGLILLKDGEEKDLMIDDNVDAQVQDNFIASLIFSNLKIGIEIDSLIVFLINFLLNVHKSPIFKMWVGIFNDILDKWIGIVRRIIGYIPKSLVNEDFVVVCIFDGFLDRNYLRKTCQEKEGQKDCFDHLRNSIYSGLESADKEVFMNVIWSVSTDEDLEYIHRLISFRLLSLNLNGFLLR